MREAENIRQVSSAGADWMGFIFYHKSPRYVADKANNLLASPVKKVGVFVNASPEEMMAAATQYKLDYLQLHGNESADLCYTLQKRGLSIIKAFSIETEEDLKQTAEYEGRVDYFLFDTKCSGYGGSGKSFDWSVLKAYKGETPFLLSGGINAASKEAILKFHHPHLAGIDLNSGFEISPGLKEVNSLQSFIHEIKNNR